MDELIMNALEALGIPIFNSIKDARIVCPNNDSAEFAVFNTVVESVTQRADNLPFCEEIQIDVHIFTPNRRNARILKERAKRLLVSSGFALDQTTQNIETDTGLTHVTVSVSFLKEFLMEV